MKTHAHTTRLAAKILDDITTKNSAYWKRREQTSALTLFKEAAVRIPAYKDFLKQHDIDPRKITTWKQFQTVPITDKDTYLRQYSLAQLCFDGTLHKPMVFASTSGSTGKPFYFPRDRELDWQQSVLNELFLKNTSLGTSSSTLVIITFGMGVWIGGLINYQAFELVSNRGYPVSILTPGVNKDEVLKALRDLAPLYEQTVVVGYPPFVKDIIDDANVQEIPLKKFNLRFLFAAEAFTETFRDYISATAHVKNPLLDTLNIYGTADIGPMAFETPISILVRQYATKNKKIAERLFFRKNASPTFAQYNPHFITFETLSENILVTGNNIVPLIRYAIGDSGGVYSLGDIIEIFRSNDIDLLQEARSKNIPIYSLPFVFVHERKDFSVKLYGAIIYPEHIREALLDQSLVAHITGKFSMQIKYNRKNNQYLQIHIELRPHTDASRKLTRHIQKTIVHYLLQANTEYHNNYTHFAKKVTPKISLASYGSPDHFKIGIKQKWVEKI
ncbi:MAG: phenylacetate-CoA ligase [Parcubacteria group bacterium Gr01-1014_48]|nr:MAG: phenylacetate-CoA ligase [Parcubacteria group bacterium Greene0416_14]TSC73396.1 MAG: phenylacetate-CoA ligase [Parcubacteria group bacterium Gr01-1014_48]TSD01678.1 MAG: phenylacetate-CoA ligase [Parcubacteria group bacterium Greene1014_15]TSD07823.1 MAG: phenylacetate-CoA ligase [Parcubacteria group bacterium Greene0714_4]